MEEAPKKICMLSSNHSLFDDRIYWKEALSLKQAGYDVCHIGVGKEDSSMISNEGIRLVQLRRNPGENFFKTLLGRKSIYYRLLEAATLEKADVYTFHDWQINLVGKKLKQLPHSPVVIYDVLEATADMLRSNIEEKGWLRKAIAVPYFKLVEKWELRCAKNYDWIITCEEKVADHFRKVVSSGRVTCIHNYSFFDPDDYLNATRSNLYDVIYAGVVMPQRGIRELIDSIAILKKSNHDVRCLIIGPLAEEDFGDFLRNKISENGLEENVMLHKAVPFSEINKYYLQSRIGICGWYPNSKNAFSIPIKIFEYMAMGLPVILTKEGVAAEYITSCDTGILVNPFSAREIADAILLLRNNKILYKKLSSNGIRAVKERYSWKKEQVILLNIFSRV